MEKVSVIVPIYNAEETLGYCINSIISQTFTNLEILLINDGSSDNSYEICKNYQKIDSRIRLFDVPNSGVGATRNLGIENATGKYIQFVDADDVINLDMIHQLIEALETYQKDIVFCGMEIIELKNNYPSKISVCTSEGLGKECVLEKKQFLKKLPTLLWKTALLEGPCNRIYKLSIIKNNNIKFPTDISLGEDFLMNMQYYMHCNGAVFISKNLYYYIQTNSESLSKKYRKDLFENQIMLIQEFEQTLKKHVNIDENEQIQLNNYTISKVITCLNNVMLIHDEKEKKANIEKIINNEFARKKMQNFDYTNPSFEWILEYLEYSDIGKIYEHLKNNENITDKIISKKIEIRNPGKLNKIVVKILNRILSSVYFRPLEILRNSIVDFGIIQTIRKILKYDYRRKDKQY